MATSVMVNSLTRRSVGSWYGSVWANSVIKVERPGTMHVPPMSAARSLLMLMQTMFSSFSNCFSLVGSMSCTYLQTSGA